MMNPADVLRTARHEIRTDNMVAAVQLVDGVIGELRVAGSPERYADIAHLLASYFRDAKLNNQCEIYAVEAVTAERKAGRKALLANHLMFLANLLSSVGRPKEALNYAEEGSALYRDVYGAEHNETAYMMSVVAQLQRVVHQGE